MPKYQITDLRIDAEGIITTRHNATNVLGRIHKSNTGKWALISPTGRFVAESPATGRKRAAATMLGVL